MISGSRRRPCTRPPRLLGPDRRLGRRIAWAREHSALPAAQLVLWPALPYGLGGPRHGVGSAFGYGAGYPSTRGGGGYSRDYSPAAGSTFANPAVPLQKAAPSHGLRADMKVFHTKFGEGTVVSIEGAGDDARAQVNFPRHGIKWLALSVAKLTPVT